MPKREYREKHYKKTKYSSDSSDDNYRDSRSRREKPRHKKIVEKSEKYQSRKNDSSSSSSYSTSDSRSRSSSSSDSRSRSKNSHSNRSTSIQKKKFTSVQIEPEQAKKFELNDLYTAKDKTKILEEIESDSFKQAAFKQSSSKIIVDLEKDKIMIPTTSANLTQDDSLIHQNFLGDNEKRVDKWIKKLYIYRNQ